MSLPVHLVVGLDTTTVRLGLLILTPLGGLAGAFFGMVKLLPERTAIVVGYQLEVINNLRTENVRLAESVAHLEVKVAKLEAEPPGHLA